LEDLGVDVMIIVKCFKEVSVDCEILDWIQFAQDKVQWRHLVNKVMKIWDPYGGEFLEQLSDC
jgi:hypothetical protein